MESPPKGVEVFLTFVIYFSFYFIFGCMKAYAENVSFRFYQQRVTFTPIETARFESNPEVHPSLTLERIFDLKLSETSDQSRREKRGAWVPTVGRSL